MNGMIKIKTLVCVFVVGLVCCFLGMGILGSSRSNDSYSNSKIHKDAAGTVRIVPYWRYSKAMKKADFVVIASAFETEDTKDKFAYKDGSIADYLIGQDTKFQTALVLKGEKNPKEFTLLHFRLNPEKLVPTNGPSLVKIQLKKKDDIIDWISSSHYGVKYLLFLNKRKDGRYETLEVFDSSLTIEKLSSAE